MSGEVIEVDKAYLKPVPDIPRLPNSEERKGMPGKKFVMVIDLSRCKNLKKCQEACNHMHYVHPGQSWVKVYSMQDAEHSAPYWQPTICMHCDESPCVKVCPVDATFKGRMELFLLTVTGVWDAGSVWRPVPIQQGYLIGKLCDARRSCQPALFM